MTLDDLARLIANPPIEYRPELRWWLAEGLHTDETLRYEIDTAHRLGFGGMEFLAMDEAAIDHARYGWGSEEWVHDSQIVVEETTKRNMSVSFTSGTNWSNANLPTIDADHPAAAQELDVVSEDLAGGRRATAPCPGSTWRPSRRPGTCPVTGARSGSRCWSPWSPPASLRRRESAPCWTSTRCRADRQVRDEALAWTAPDDGPWRLFVYWMHGTGQTASPSASINYTVNYVDPDGAQAVIDYWDTVVLTPELREQIARNPRAQMYMDSLELSTYGAGGLFWGRTVAEEFAPGADTTSHRGCRSSPANVLFMAAATIYHHEPPEEHRITVEKVRFDYVRTLTDLYIENMLRPFADFLHENGIRCERRSATGCRSSYPPGP